MSKDTLQEDELNNDIYDMLSTIECDFGYAVGNLQADTIPESNKEIVNKLLTLISKECDRADRGGRIEGKKMFAFHIMGIGKITPEELTKYYEMFDNELEALRTHTTGENIV